MPKLEFFFDCSSPWTYLAFHNIQQMARRTGTDIIWRPILVGGVFNEVNQQIYRNRESPVPLKSAYVAKDLQDWANYSGLTINSPPKCGHPVNSVKCMRACVALDGTSAMVLFAQAAFEALWIDGLNIGTSEVIAGLCKKINIDEDWLLAKIDTDDVKLRLRTNTDELIRRGGFGSPTIFLNDNDMYFGNDRIVLVEHTLLKGQAPRE